MTSRYLTFTFIAVLAINVTACTFSSIDTQVADSEPFDVDYNVAKDGYIKAFNVGATSQVETKTMFHTDGLNYGLTTWEPGQDELVFIRRDSLGEYNYVFEKEDFQLFGCQNSFEKDSYQMASDIKWARYRVLQDNTGLKVGSNYYAYYMNGKYQQLIPDSCLPIDTFDQTGQSDVSLQNFMRDYDYLLLESDQHDGNDVANGGIVVVSPLGDVYMDHYFSLIEVDIHWKSDMTYYSAVQRKYVTKTFKYPFFIVQFGTGNGVDIFAQSISLDPYGQLQINSYTTFIQNNRKDPNDDLILTESNNLLKYYFLVRCEQPSDHYWIKVFDAAANQRTIHYRWTNGGEYQFKPGYYYKFEVDADFSELKSDTVAKEWQDHGILVARDADYLLSKGIETWHENN